jgi:hypothetical protein
VGVELVCLAGERRQSLGALGVGDADVDAVTLELVVALPGS